ncbi:MAG: single-stranded DNA-binding protein [Bacteriovorax sp.]
MVSDVIEVFSGRLGVDPYLAYTKKGEPVCEMSLGLKNIQNEITWRKVVVFGKLAELCKVHLKKGNQVFVHGRMQLRKFTNKDGLEKEYYEVNAFSVGQSLL